MRPPLIAGIVGVLFLGVAILYQPGTSLEEIQTGGLAQSILETHSVPLEFAATNLVAALGFALGGHSLLALRSGFIVSGLLTFGYLATVLLQRRGGFFPVAATLLAIAATPMTIGFVSHADEICFGFSLSLLLLALLVSSSERPSLPLLMAQVVVASALAYEYTAYKFLTLLLSPLIALHFIRFWRESEGKMRWGGSVAVGALFVFSLSPLFLNLWQTGAESFLLDGLHRHVFSEQPSRGMNWRELWSKVAQYYAVLFGIGPGDTHFVGGGRGLWHWSLAIPLFLAASYASRRDQVARICVLHAAIAPLFAGSLAQNVEPLRMGAAFAGLAVGGLLGFSELTLKVSHAGARYAVGVFGVASALWSASLLPSIGESVELRTTHSHDNYPLCMLLRTIWNEGDEPVQLYPFDNFAQCTLEGEDRWIVPEELEVIRRSSLDQVDPSSGGAIIFAKRYGVTAAQAALTESWAFDHGRRIVWVYDLVGRKFAAIVEEQR